MCVPVLPQAVFVCGLGGCVLYIVATLVPLAVLPFFQGFYATVVRNNGKMTLALGRFVACFVDDAGSKYLLSLQLLLPS